LAICRLQIKTIYHQTKHSAENPAENQAEPCTMAVDCRPRRGRALTPPAQTLRTPQCTPPVTARPGPAHAAAPGARPAPHSPAGGGHRGARCCCAGGMRVRRRRSHTRSAAPCLTWPTQPKSVFHHAGMEVRTLWLLQHAGLLLRILLPMRSVRTDHGEAPAGQRLFP